MNGTETRTDLARVADGLRTEFRRNLSSLRRQLGDEIRVVARAAEKQAKEVDERLTVITSAQHDLHRHTHRGLRDTRRDLERIEGHVLLVEGRLRIEHGVVPIDLDSVPADLAEVVEQVRAAETIRTAILDDEVCAQYEARVRAYRELERMAGETRLRTLRASRELATHPAGGRAFRQAAAGYRRERTLWESLQEELDATAEGRREAQEALDRDEGRRREYLACNGAAAIEQLTTWIRGRIDAAVAGHALFPAWFTITELGHRPPATRTAEWREVAVQVVLYRLTHRVEDVMLALGPDPDAAILASLQELVQ